MPVYKGSTFRGVFGRALKKVVCNQNKSLCKNCRQKDVCLYVLVFETHLAAANSGVPRSAGMPHPFVIEPPLQTRTTYRAGDPFDFNLLLFGRVNHNLPYFIYALEEMGRIGIGRKINGRRGRFVLERVDCGTRLVFTRRQKFIVGDLPTTDMTLASLPGDHASGEPVTVRLATPLRLKFKNRMQAQLPFHVLVRACLRRVSGLLNHYDEGEPDLDYPGLVRRAEKVVIQRHALHWCDWRRYSFRQERDMLMGGMVGEVTYKNVPGRFMPLLAFAEKTHIGKQTAFGLGKISLIEGGEKGFTNKSLS